MAWKRRSPPSVSSYTAVETPSGSRLRDRDPHEHSGAGRRTLPRIWTRGSRACGSRTSPRVRTPRGDGTTTRGPARDSCPITATASASAPATAMACRPPPVRQRTVYTQANAPARVALHRHHRHDSIQVQWGPTAILPAPCTCARTLRPARISGWIPDTTWDEHRPAAQHLVHLPRQGPQCRRPRDRLDESGDAVHGLPLADGQLHAGRQGELRPGRTSFGTRPAHYRRSRSPHPWRVTISCDWTGSAVDAGRVADPDRRADHGSGRCPLHARGELPPHADLRGQAGDRREGRIELDERLRVPAGCSRCGASRAMRSASPRASTSRMRAEDVLTGDRTRHVRDLKSGVAVKGGYAGLGESRTRTPATSPLYETILSGDLKSDDSPVSDAPRSLQRACGAPTTASTWSRMDVRQHDPARRRHHHGRQWHRRRRPVPDPQRSGHLPVHHLRQPRRPALRRRPEGWGQGAGVSCYLSRADVLRVRVLTPTGPAARAAACTASRAAPP